MSRRSKKKEQRTAQKTEHARIAALAAEMVQEQLEKDAIAESVRATRQEQRKTLQRAEPVKISFEDDKSKRDGTGYLVAALFDSKQFGVKNSSVLGYVANRLCIGVTHTATEDTQGKDRTTSVKIRATDPKKADMFHTLLKTYIETQEMYRKPYARKRFSKTSIDTDIRILEDGGKIQPKIYDVPGLPNRTAPPAAHNTNTAQTFNARATQIAQQERLAAIAQGESIHPPVKFHPSLEKNAYFDLAKAESDKERQMLIASNAELKTAYAAIHDNDVTFIVGPRGTGKTRAALLMGLQDLAEGKVKQIILTRPTVEVGARDSGALPGNEVEKSGPFVAPMTALLTQLVGKTKYEEMEKFGQLKIAPLSFMRGRTFEDAFFIVDEAQNTTEVEFDMLEGRPGGKKSKFVVCGDLVQTDLHHKAVSGLEKPLEALRKVDTVEMYKQKLRGEADVSFGLVELNITRRGPIPVAMSALRDGSLPQKAFNTAATPDAQPPVPAAPAAPAAATGTNVHKLNPSGNRR